MLSHLSPFNSNLIGLAAVNTSCIVFQPLQNAYYFNINANKDRGLPSSHGGPEQGHLYLIL